MSVRILRDRRGALRAFNSGRPVPLSTVWERADGQRRTLPHLLGPDESEDSSDSGFWESLREIFEGKGA